MQIWTTFFGGWVSAGFASLASLAMGGWAWLFSAEPPVVATIALAVFVLLRMAAVVAHLPAVTPTHPVGKAIPDAAPAMALITDTAEESIDLQGRLAEEIAKLESRLDEKIALLLDVANAQRQRHALADMKVDFEELEKDIAKELENQRDSAVCRGLRARLTTIVKNLQRGCGLEHTTQKMLGIADVARRHIRTKHTAEQHEESTYLEYEYPLVKEMINECDQNIYVFFKNWNRWLRDREEWKKDKARREQLERAKNEPS